MKAYNFVPKCNKLLDIGCDYGDFSIQYKVKAKKVYAIDPNEKVIAIAKKKHKDIIFKTASAEKIPYADNSFDVINIDDQPVFKQYSGKILQTKKTTTDIPLKSNSGELSRIVRINIIKGV